MESVESFPAARFHLPSVGRGLPALSGGALNGPAGPSIAPSHDLIAAHCPGSNPVGTYPLMHLQVATILVGSSRTSKGALFDLMATPAGVSFVDDATPRFNLFH